MPLIHKFRSRPWRFTLLAALTGAVLFGVIAHALPAPYETSLAFTINQRQRQPTPDYQYDGYYALKASELFADTLISWFGTPSFVVDVYKDAGTPIAPGAIDIAAAVNGFHAKKLSTQNVVIRFSMRDRASAENVARAAVSAVMAKTAVLNQDEKGQALFIVTAAAPVIVLAPISPVRAALVGLLLGAIAAAAALYFATPPEE